jgi:hypothetical protein
MVRGGCVRSVSGRAVVLVVLAAVAVLVLVVVPLLQAWRVRRRRIAALAHEWGQSSRSPRDDRALAAALPLLAGGAAQVDPATWADLDLERVFHWADRTLTAIGAQTLYAWLRSIPASPAEIRARIAAARTLVADARTRVAIQRVLLDLGDRRGWHAPLALAGDLPAIGGHPWLFRALAAALVGVSIAALVLGSLGLFVAAVALAVGNATIHYVVAQRMSEHLDGFEGLRRIVLAARRMLPLVPDDAFGSGAQLRADAARLRRFAAVAAGELPTTTGAPVELAHDYLRSFLLTDVIAYVRGIRTVQRERAALERLVVFVGAVDAALAREQLVRTEPDLVEAELVADAEVLELERAKHPLVRAAVANDLRMHDRGLVVTGSNMAGKSTLLRTVGVNAVLAQGLGLACAQRYRGPIVRVASSMRVHDDLASQVSTYMAELQRVAQLLSWREEAPRCVFLLDEVFRGTNPAERIAATAAVVLELVRAHFVVIATHDLELVTLTRARFDCAHFGETIADGELSFDFRLRAGPSEHTNAIALLETTGFPAAVVDAARRFAART